MKPLKVSLLLGLAGLLTPMARAASPPPAGGPESPSNAPLATFTVDAIFDEPDADLADGECRSTPTEACTLRSAIQQANALAGDDVVGFSPAINGTPLRTTRLGTEDLGVSGDLDITGNLTLMGNGEANTIVDGNAELTMERVFHVHPGAVVTMRDMTVRRGLDTNFGGGIYSLGELSLFNVTVSGNQGGYGGGIANFGVLNLRQSVLITNTASIGGGLYNQGTFTIGQNSRVSSNEAVDGAGIYTNNSGPSIIVASRVSGNAAGGSGGGIYHTGASELTLTGGQVYGNTSGNQIGTGGGGIFNVGPITIRGTEVTRNTGSKGGGIFNEVGASLTLAQGTAVVTNTAALDGGGLYNNGNAAAQGTSISGNVSTSASGGGVFNRSGRMTLANSVVGRNSALGQGGGIYNTSALTVTNSTMTTNTAGGDGGGAYNMRILGLLNSTVVFNVADKNNDASETGGGIFDAAYAYMRNSILAGNQHLDVSGGPFPLAVRDDCSGTVGVDDYNLVEEIAGCTLDGVGTGNIYALSPLLGPLADNGGPTWSHALLPGSPAIDAANPAGCKDPQNVVLTTDQRGAPRPIGGRCDMGAFEFGGVVPTPTTTPSSTLPPSATATASRTPPDETLTATNPPTGSPTATATNEPATSGTPPATWHVYLPRALRP